MSPSKEVTHIDIGTDFSKILGPRYKRLGKYSGEEFFERILLPAFESSDRVVVSLDSIKGPSASFFEEAFGGLVRRFGLRPVEDKVAFVSIRRPFLIGMIRGWMHEAAIRSR